MQNNPLEVFAGGWEQLSSSSYTDNQVTVPSTSTNSFTIKPDGEEIYVLADNIVETYALAVDYDPNSLDTTPIRSFTVTDDAAPLGITFQDDGTQMFIGGTDSKVMLSYTLPVPFDTSSIVASPASKSLSDIVGNLLNSTFSRDGDFFFTTSTGPTFVHSFPLPTPWDITSNVSSTTFDPEMGALLGIAFKPQGDKMYLIDFTAAETIEFDLSTIYDITTGLDSGNVLDFSPSNFRDLKFRSHGDEVTFIDPDGNVIRYHLDEDWNISTASHFTNEFDTLIGNPFAITWKPDGLSFYILDGLGGQRSISQFDVPNRFNQTGAVFFGSFSLTDVDNNIQSMYWREDGLRCYVIGITNDNLVQLDLTGAWNISTMSDSGIFYDASLELVQSAGVYFRDDGLKWFVSDQNLDDILEYDMLVPYDIANSVLVSTTAIPVETLAGIFFRLDGRKLYVCERGGGDNLIVLFNLSEPWDLSTLTFQASLDVELQVASVRGLFIREVDGKKLYVIGNTNDTVFSYDMSLEFNETIITNFGEDLITEAGEFIVYQ